MYFITICTKNKIKMLSEIINNTTVGNDALVVPSKIGEMVNECWNNIQTKNKNIYINEYIIMPNHIHGIIEITNQKEVHFCIDKKYGFETIEHQKHIYDKNGFEVSERRGRRSLQNIIKDFKSVTTRKYNAMVNEKYKNCLWQKSYYEHVIRNEKELYKIQEYIQNNPINWIIDENNI